MTRFLNNSLCIKRKEPETRRDLSEKRKIKQAKFLTKIYAKEMDKYSKKWRHKIRNEYAEMPKEIKHKFVDFEEYYSHKSLEHINSRKIKDYIKKHGFETIKEQYERYRQKPFYDEFGEKTGEFLDFILEMSKREEDAEYTFMTGCPIFNENGEHTDEYLEYHAEKTRLMGLL